MLSNIFKLRVMAVAVTLASTGSVWALTPNDGAPQLSLYLPGSQANDPAFGFPVDGASLVNGVCEQPALANASITNPNSDTTTHVYFQNSTTKPTSINDNYSAIYCYTNDTLIPGLTTGDATNHHRTRLWISRRRLGASGVGLDAVAHGTTLTYFADPISAKCTAGNNAYASGGTTYPYNYTCTTTTAGITASAAVSDVTPDVFNAPTNVYAGTKPILPGQISNIKPIGIHIIGTPVTMLLRNALQLAQIQVGQLPTTCIVGDETASCVPSLTKEQLVSIFSGAITDWTQFQVTAKQTLADVVAAAVTANNGPILGTVNGVANTVLLNNPLDTTVHICRRENGAGQQVAFLASIMQYPCLGSSSPQLGVYSASNLNDVEYATSLGAVDSCLGDYNDGTNNWFGTTNPAPYQNPPAKTVAHGNQWAISIQTTERNATNAANYRFIAIDGALPIGSEAYLNRYRLLGEYTLSWNSKDANTVAALNAIVAESGLPATIAARNTHLSNQTFGQAGYLALSDLPNVPSYPWNPANPVYPFSKVTISGNAPDACSVPIANNNVGTGALQLGQ